MLTIPELAVARDFLRQAHIRLGAVRTLFIGVGDHGTAARLKRIQLRIADEIAAIERLIAGHP